MAYYKNGDKSWTLTRDVGIFCYDATYYKGQFYAVDQYGQIAVFDINRESPNVVSEVKYIRPPRLHSDCHMSYLVNSGNDELFLVLRVWKKKKVILN